MNKTLWLIRFHSDTGSERKHQKPVLSEPISLNQSGLFVLFQILLLFLHHSSWGLFSPDHNQAPISSYCSGWKAISCTPADVLWDMNDLIKSHAKGPEMSARACGRWKLALVPSRQEMRRSLWVNDSKHPQVQVLIQCFMSWSSLSSASQPFIPEAPLLTYNQTWDRPP